MLGVACRWKSTLPLSGELIETVMGVQALRDARQWSVQDVDKTWSEEALTAAVMPRYHVDIAVKRALGAKLGTLKEKNERMTA